jgi:hypothetical protein
MLSGIFAVQEFDGNQFDAFCLCLECCSSDHATDTPYAALCEWLLEISVVLIHPASANDGRYFNNLD